MHSVGICDILISYSLTPCSRVLLEKLTGFAAIKKFPVYYGTRKFITVLTSTRDIIIRATIYLAEPADINIKRV